MRRDAMETLLWLTPIVFLMWVLFTVALASTPGNRDIEADLQQSNYRVIDGDTFEWNGTRVRLHGIDAPENGQPCVRMDGLDVDCAGSATAALESKFEGGERLECTYVSKSYARLVMICFIDGEDIGLAMVSAGHAFHDPAYSKGLYKGQMYVAELAARLRGLGVWQDGLGVEYPWVWRNRNR